MNHLIFDFETLSADPTNCVVIDCSAFIFSDVDFNNNPYNLDTIGDIKKFKLSVSNQKEQYKYKVSKDTLEFWSKQSVEAQSKLQPKSTDITVPEFVEQLVSYISSVKKIDYWWSRSNSFDPTILWRLAKDSGHYSTLDKLIPHWKLRDTRTWIDAKMRYPKQNGFTPIKDEELWKRVFVQHDSAWDILADILRLQAIHRVESDLELL